MAWKTKSLEEKTWSFKLDFLSGPCRQLRFGHGSSLLQLYEWLLADDGEWGTARSVTFSLAPGTCLAQRIAGMRVFRKCPWFLFIFRSAAQLTVLFKSGSNLGSSWCRTAIQMELRGSSMWARSTQKWDKPFLSHLLRSLSVSRCECVSVCVNSALS